MKPILLATGHAPTYRVGAFSHLHEREGIEVALFGGRSRHGGAEYPGELPFPHRRVRPRELARAHPPVGEGQLARVLGSAVP